MQPYYSYKSPNVGMKFPGTKLHKEHLTHSIFPSTLLQFFPELESKINYLLSPQSLKELKTKKWKKAWIELEPYFREVYEIFSKSTEYLLKFLHDNLGKYERISITINNLDFLKMIAVFLQRWRYYFVVKPLITETYLQFVREGTTVVVKVGDCVGNVLLEFPLICYQFFHPIVPKPTRKPKKVPKEEPKKFKRVKSRLIQIYHLIKEHGITLSPEDMNIVKDIHKRYMRRQITYYDADKLYKILLKMRALELLGKLFEYIRVRKIKLLPHEEEYVRWFVNVLNTRELLTREYREFRDFVKSILQER